MPVKFRLPLVTSTLKITHTGDYGDINFIGGGVGNFITRSGKTGNVLTLTGPNGLTTTWEYDVLGRQAIYANDFVNDIFSNGFLMS
jgi:hypothetical protein